MWNDEDDVDAESSQRHFRGADYWTEFDIPLARPVREEEGKLVRMLALDYLKSSTGEPLAESGETTKLSPAFWSRIRDGDIEKVVKLQELTDAYNLLWFGAHGTDEDGGPDSMKFKGLELELSLASLKESSHVKSYLEQYATRIVVRQVNGPPTLAPTTRASLPDAATLQAGAGGLAGAVPAAPGSVPVHWHAEAEPQPPPAIPAADAARLRAHPSAPEALSIAVAPFASAALVRTKAGERIGCPSCEERRHKAESMCVLYRWIHDKARTEPLPARPNEKLSINDVARKAWIDDPQLRARLVEHYSTQ